MAHQVKHALFLLAEKLLTWCISPYLRARLLRLLGASIGRNVRIYEARFFNLADGFRNLHLADDVHVGPGCLIDLTDAVNVGEGAVISPGVTILTHADPGSHHDAPLARAFPPRQAPCTVGASAWIGANAVLLCGADIGGLAVVGANSLVSGAVPARTVVAGSPARHVRNIDIPDAPEKRQ